MERIIALKEQIIDSHKQQQQSGSNKQEFANHQEKLQIIQSEQQQSIQYEQQEQQQLNKEYKYLVINELPNQKVLVQLNNAARKNAINTEMSRQIKDIVQNPKYKIIIINSAQEALFGCGGDVKDLYSYLISPDKTNLFNYFLTEFENNYCFYLFNQIDNCGSIAIYDGYTIGEALLMTCYSKIKICTERTVMLMPECKNGLAIYSPQYFYRLENNIGSYLWMTGEQVRGKDCVRYGLADYCVHSSQLQSLNEELNQSIDIEHCISICQKYAQYVDKTAEDDNNLLNYIKQTFKLVEFDQFWKNLTFNSTQTQDIGLQKFSIKCLQQMNASSRISIRFNYMLLQKCQGDYDILEFNLMQIKSAINMTFLYQDCIEGLKKAVIQKTYKPQWCHKNLLDVNQSELEYISSTDEYIKDQQERVNLFLKIATQIMQTKAQLIQKYSLDQNNHIANL